MGSQKHKENQTKAIKPRFQDQWLAKAIEKNKKTKKNKISGPMGSQSH